jgi:hypothetical protein
VAEFETPDAVPTYGEYAAGVTLIGGKKRLGLNTMCAVKCAIPPAPKRAKSSFSGTL